MNSERGESRSPRLEQETGSTPVREGNIEGAAGLPGRISNVVFTVAATASVLSLVAMTLLTVAEVLARNLHFQAPRGVIELSEVLLVIAVFLGLAEAYRTRSHVAVSFLVDRLPAPLSRALQRVGIVLLLLLLIWLSFHTAARAIESYQDGEYRFGLINVPLWPGRVAIAVGFALTTLCAIQHLLSRNLGDEADATAGTGAV